MVQALLLVRLSRLEGLDRKLAHETYAVRQKSLNDFIGGATKG